MDENQTSARRKFLQTLSVGSLTVLAGCSSSNSSNSDNTTDDGDNTTDASESNTEAQNSVFSDYYTEGDEFVVELNSNNADSVEEVILYYNEDYPSEHPRQSVQGISTARFSLEVSGKNDPQEGTWEIEAVGSGETVETAEYEAERSLSLNKVGTVAQSDKFEHTDGLGIGDLQYSITNDGDIPTTAYTSEFTSSFISKAAKQNVLGLGEGNPEPELVADQALEFRRAGNLCFDLQEDGNAEDWVDQSVEAALIVNAGSTSDSWTYPLSVNFGSDINSEDLSECIKGTTVSKRDTE